MANFARIRLILELHDRGMSQDEISRSRHMSRSTITTVLRTARKKGITYAGIRKLDDAALQKLFFLTDRKVQTCTSCRITNPSIKSSRSRV